MIFLIIQPVDFTSFSLSLCRVLQVSQVLLASLDLAGLLDLREQLDPLGQKEHLYILHDSIYFIGALLFRNYLASNLDDSTEIMFAANFSFRMINLENAVPSYYFSLSPLWIREIPVSPDSRVKLDQREKL